MQWTDYKTHLSKWNHKKTIRNNNCAHRDTGEQTPDQNRGWLEVIDRTGGIERAQRESNVVGKRTQKCNITWEPTPSPREKQTFFSENTASPKVKTNFPAGKITWHSAELGDTKGTWASLKKVRSGLLLRKLKSPLNPPTGRFAIP